jgi:mRNA deadenylase 3'-5' endonuclease subunit Ccr4
MIFKKSKMSNIINSAEKKDKLKDKLHSCDNEYKLPRKWTKFSKEKKNAFTIVSYNGLSQKILENHLYLYNKNILQSKTRMKTIYHELKSYAAQIICLQEAEPHILQIFKKCVWSRNNEIDVAFAQCNTPRTDGCAILVDSYRFSIINVKRLNLTASENKPNTGIVVTLNDKQGDILIVACTHLLFNPKRGDIRLNQCISFIEAIEEAKAEVKINTQKDIRIIVTGDFNSYPNSAIYSYLSKGYINKDALTKRTTNDNNREHPFKYVNKRCITDLKPYPDININCDVISHSLQLKSIYAINEGENAFTTYIPKGTKACVDYIFASNLIPIGRLEIPLLKELREGLPSQKYPSDHIALVARFV